jgi:hypothetical protein
MLIDHYRTGINEGCDPYWDYVVLLARMDSGAMVEHTGGLTTTVVGSGVVSSALAKFGTASFYLNELDSPVDGTDRIVFTDPVSTTRFTFPGEFTMEAWIAPVNLSDAAANNIFANNVAHAATGFFALDVVADSMAFRHNATLDATSTVPNAFIDNTTQWQHFAVTRDVANIVRIFVDGVLKTTSAGAVVGTVGGVDAAGKSTFTVGHGRAFVVGDIKAYTDQIRVTKLCRYTANFTPSLTAFPPLQCPTVMLIHVEGGVMYERSGFPVVSTVGGGAVSSVQAKFGTQSFNNPGTGVESTNYVSVIAASPVFIFPGEFTIEGWFYTRSINASYMNLFANNINYPGAGFIQMALRPGSNDLMWNASSGGSAVTAPLQVPLNQWVHLAVTRDASDVFRMFINGVMGHSSVKAGTIGGASGGVSTLDIGRGHASDNGDFNGFFEEIRVEKVCRYAANFTPPTVPFDPYP